MLALIVCGVYTALILCGIYYYEDKLRDLSGAIEDYKRALNIAKNNNMSQHYTFLQLENQQLKKDIVYLSDANDHLQSEIKSLRIDNQDLKSGTWGKYKGYSVSGDSKDIQYESSTYKNNAWD